MRLSQLLLLSSVQSLAISPIANEASLFDVRPSDANISSNYVKMISNNTKSLNEMQVICRAADPFYPYAIDADFCGPAISIACRALRDMAVTRERQETHERQGLWNWVALTPEMNCAAGFFVPLEARPSMFPSLNDCHSLIFEHILYVCGRNQRINVGTINIDRLPSSSTPGTAIRESYPRYLMASKTL